MQMYKSNQVSYMGSLGTADFQMVAFNVKGRSETGKIITDGTMQKISLIK